MDSSRRRIRTTRIGKASLLLELETDPLEPLGHPCLLAVDRRLVVSLTIEAYAHERRRRAALSRKQRTRRQIRPAVEGVLAVEVVGDREIHGRGDGRLGNSIKSLKM